MHTVTRTHGDANTCAAGATNPVRIWDGGADGRTDDVSEHGHATAHATADDRTDDTCDIASANDSSNKGSDGRAHWIFAIAYSNTGSDADPDSSTDEWTAN
jgi:hypothetical protein